jgi:hypothetical protein
MVHKEKERRKSRIEKKMRNRVQNYTNQI